MLRYGFSVVQSNKLALAGIFRVLTDSCFSRRTWPRGRMLHSYLCYTGSLACLARLVRLSDLHRDCVTVPRSSQVR